MTLPVDDLLSTDVPLIPNEITWDHSLRNSINQAFLSNFSGTPTNTLPEAEEGIFRTMTSHRPLSADFHLANHPFP
jgi:hypothetical protein